MAHIKETAFGAASRDNNRADANGLHIEFHGANHETGPGITGLSHGHADRIDAATSERLASGAISLENLFHRQFTSNDAIVAANDQMARTGPPRSYHDMEDSEAVRAVRRNAFEEMPYAVRRRYLEDLHND
jgi:hypothetical protein